MLKSLIVGKSVKLGRVPQVMEIPNLIELQRQSYDWFVDEGMRETFDDISPITDFTGNLILEFQDYNLGDPLYSQEECRDRGMTYARPLKVKVRLITKEDGEVKEVKEQEIFMGDFPAMTPKGTFIINGAERVIVSQLVRSPGVYFKETREAWGKSTYNATVIPNRGAWLEFESDANNIIGARIDKTRKIPVTVLIRALGYPSDEEILEVFGNDPVIAATLEKDTIKSSDDALIEIYRKLRPGDPPTVESARTLLNNLFFDPKRYNLAKVGRYKLSKKLVLPIVCTTCGTLHKPGEITCGDCGEKLIYQQTLCSDDIVAVVKHLSNLVTTQVPADDIDHLGNRRVRAVGELLQNQFRVGLLRLERVVRERMTVQDLETVTPQALINIRPVVAAIKEFFGSSQLSQFMDQTNTLAELTHKRRLSALGPGGLSRERAGFEVRDVHYSHYGRICPIETPEGPNIGLIGSLATFGRVNEFGFIMTPYRKVHKGLVSDEIVYLCADEEDDHVIGQANTAIGTDHRLTPDRVVVRKKHETEIVPRDEVDLMDVSPMQIVSVATALIPFLQNDDANRALMGANMQRQAVPLLAPQAALVGTGIEMRAAKDSGSLVIAEEDGVVASADANEIVVQNKKNKNKKHAYHLAKFKRSNAGTCINQRPAVSRGQEVKEGDILADGASSVKGDLALGRNVLVAFMPWEGYNYEDAILISEDLVKEDVFTSIHIEEYECEARDTKLGAEEITRDISNVGEEALKDLDERGIIAIGADVLPEDILVGKVTPKGETELTAEERLLRAIFGEKARDVRDTSLRVPHGEKGKVIDVKVFSREAGDELSPGVNQLVRVYVAQKRKILQGDKMAGRHGNKGVIAKVLPVEDMPYLPDGTPVQIVLNPLGVPSRMNLGQILETHLGLAAADLDLNMIVPVFDGAKEEEIRFLMKMGRLRNLLFHEGLTITPLELEAIVADVSLAERVASYLSGKGLDVPQDALEVLLLEAGDHVDAVAALAKKRKLSIDKGELRQALVQRSVGDRWDAYLASKGLQFPEDQQARLRAIITNHNRLKIDGKSELRDGRTGLPFDNRITVGWIYMLKLAHLVDDKIHARSTGPYSLITQQPLGGKAQFGGQRFGEMEVWALEAYGAAYTLQELLTVKSDDVVGRVKTYEAIVKGENVMEPGVPESFKVLIKELQSLCLDVKILSGEDKEIEIRGGEEDVRTTARQLGLEEVTASLG